jgi:membrane protein implicated in regulation of membrane protease activity
MTLENARQIYQDAQDAADLLQSGCYQRAMAAVLSETIATWREAITRDEREDMFHQQNAIRKVNGWLLRQVEKAAEYDARMKVEGSTWRTTHKNLLQGKEQ